jgi:hypothetical protein
MGSTGSQRSRRREEIWAQWRGHLEAQRASGQTQLAYCQAHGLEAKHFSVWKSKLKRAAEASPARGTAKPSKLRLVPLVIRNRLGTHESAATTEPLTIHLQLPNGLAVSMSVASLSRLPCVLEHLARAAC